MSIRNSKLIVEPLIWLGEHFPATMIRLRYLARFHRLPDLKHPKDLNEKILYQKLYTDTSVWTRLADKYRVRDYVKECGLEDILIPFYGAWEQVEDIDFDSLPQQFILKANNGDGKGTNMKIDKSAMTDDDWTRLRQTLQEWLSRKHIGALSAEPHYRGIKPMILAEKLLLPEHGQSSVVDYKIWCLSGNPYLVFVCSDRKENGYEAIMSCYDMEWNDHPEWLVDTPHLTHATEPLPRPACFEQMLEVARCLSKPFPQVRVDLYESEGQVWFGELTFTSLSGMMDYFSPTCLQEMGKLVNLETETNKT